MPEKDYGAPSPKTLMVLRKSSAWHSLSPENQRTFLISQFPFFDPEAGRVPEENFENILRTLRQRPALEPPGAPPLGEILDPLERAGQALGIQGVGRSIQEYQTEAGEAWEQGGVLGKGYGALMGGLSPFAPAIQGAANVFRVAGTGMAEKALAETGVPREEYLSMVEKPSGYTEEIQKIANLTEDRPSTGWDVTDTLADILSASIPLGELRAVRLAWKALKAGNPLRALSVIRKEAPEAADSARRFLADVPKSTFDDVADQPYLPGFLKTKAMGAPARAIRRVIGLDPVDTLWTKFKQRRLTFEEQRKIEELDLLGRGLIDDEYEKALLARGRAAKTADPAGVAARRAEQLELPDITPPEPGALMHLTKTQLKVLREKAKAVNLDAQDLAMVSKTVIQRAMPTNARELRDVTKAVDSFKDIKQLGHDIPSLLMEGRVSPKYMGKAGLLPKAMRQLIMSTRWSLNQQGTVGKQVARLFDSVDNNSELRAGKAVAKLRRIAEQLTLAEQREVRKFLDFGVAPRSPKAVAASTELRTMLNEMGMNAQTVGLKVRFKDGRSLDFNPKDDYFPRLIKREILSDNKLLNKAARWLVEDGQAGDNAEAVRLLRSYMDFHSRRRFGSMEKARELDLPEEFYETDLVKALTTYFERGYRRLEEAEHFGADDQYLIELMRRSDLLEGADPKFMEEAIKAFVGTRRGAWLGGDMDDIYQMARAYQTITRLTLAPIINFSQSVMTAMRTDMMSTGEALVDVFKGVVKRRPFSGKMSEAEEFSLQAGATLESISREIARQAGGSSEFMVGKFMRVIGFNYSERLNRTIAAVAGRKYAERMAGRYVKSTGRKKNLAGKELRRLGIDPTTLSREGTVQSDDLLKAAQQVVNDSQFRARVQDLPLFWTTPEGRVMTQFKNFVYNSTKLLTREIAQNMVSDPRRAARNITYLFTLFPATGASFEGARRAGREWVNERLVEILPEEMVTDIEFEEAPDFLVEAIHDLGFSNRDSKVMAAHLNDMAAAGSLGIFFDLWTSAQFGDQAVGSTLMGPTFRFVTEAFSTGAVGVGALGTELGTRRSAKRESREAIAKSAGRFFQRNVPVISPFLTGPRKKPTKMGQLPRMPTGPGG